MAGPWPDHGPGHRWAMTRAMAGPWPGLGRTIAQGIAGSWPGPRPGHKFCCLLIKLYTVGAEQSQNKSIRCLARSLEPAPCQDDSIDTIKFRTHGVLHRLDVATLFADQDLDLRLHVWRLGWPCTDDPTLPSVNYGYIQRRANRKHSSAAKGV